MIIYSNKEALRSIALGIRTVKEHVRVSLHQIKKGNIYTGAELEWAGMDYGNTLRPSSEQQNHQARIMLFSRKKAVSSGDKHRRVSQGNPHEYSYPESGYVCAVHGRRHCGVCEFGGAWEKEELYLSREVSTHEGEESLICACGNPLQHGRAECKTCRRKRN